MVRLDLTIFARLITSQVIQEHNPFIESRPTRNWDLEHLDPKKSMISTSAATSVGRLAKRR